MKTLLIFLIVSLNADAGGWEEYFEFSVVADPVGIDPQVGAMDGMKDGRIAVAFHRGEVMIYDPSSSSWSMFASGLQEPLGLLCEGDGSVLVMQRAELTRLRDTDGDGVADEYETVFDGFGMSGNYHEFAYGPARDGEGNLFVALGLASNGAPMREEIRGRFSQIGELDQAAMADEGGWAKNQGRAGRMYSRVEWRGWVLKISADGKEMEPYASGFRSPNGIGFDGKGRLLVTDNQGDWRPTSPLYDVKKDGFYGHPASLVWRTDWDGRDPLKVDVAELGKMQTAASGYFPQGELANSPTWPVVVPEGAFPVALAGQTLIGEMNQPNLVRVLEDEVGGFFQPALVPMFDGSPLGIGNNRMVFGKDGSLFVGKTALSWAGGKGISRIRWRGKNFPCIEGLRARAEGFEIRLSEPVDAATLGAVAVSSHTYHYFATYGSEKVDVQEMAVKATRLAGDGRTLNVDLGGLKRGCLHCIDLSGLRVVGGGVLLGGKVWYHAVEVPGK